MSVTTGILEQMRQEIVDHLEAIPFFDTIAVLAEDKKDIASEINRALGLVASKGGKCGAVVILMTVVAKPGKTEGWGPVFENILHVVRVLENPVLNRGANGTGKTSGAIAEAVAGYVNMFTPLTASGPLVFCDPGLTVANDPQYPGHDVYFKTSGALAVTLTKAGTPVCSLSDGRLQMVCSTPGAAIFYSVDGKKPSPRCGTLYAGSIVAPAQGVTVRARAWLAGYLASDVGTWSAA